MPHRRRTLLLPAPSAPWLDAAAPHQAGAPFRRPRLRPPKVYNTSEDCMRVKAQKLQEDVQMLFQTFTSVVQKMNLIDTLQRLGIDHLFEDQINTAMNEIHEKEFNSCSLYDVALRFRLLRESGLRVSPDVFSKFKGKDGSLSRDIISEPRGLLSLYNAAYLSIPGESELDEAVIFAGHHLESMRSSLNYPFSEQVKRNLEIPLPRTLKRLDAPYYIAEYQQEKAYNTTILELAKLDFNLLQRLHQEEIKAFCQWGNDLYEEVRLTYSRHRIVECYFWSYTEYHERHYGDARIILAKLLVLVTLLDDTFDMHATLEEGWKLNEAIQRWDESAITLLPEYLKGYFVRLMNTFREFEDELKPDHKYRVAYSRKAITSVISAGTPTLFVGSLMGMGDEASKEAFEWAIGCTDAVRACGEVARFMDDLASFKHGKNKLDVASSIESYINQHHCTDEVAMDVLDNLVEDAWKTTNQARFDRGALLPLVNRVANLTKSMTLLFRNKVDRYTFSHGNKDRIRQQFIDPIPL
uniref:(+)-delta-cadinene synthase isozyme C2 n=1 Tax=Aegilops tauschii TaxID=37682 RepID=R7WFZ2_AEGTA